MGVDPVVAQGTDEDQLARIRPALMALPPLAAVLRVRAVALVRDGRSLLEGVAERPQSALDHIAVRQSAALGKQRLQSSHRDLRTGANGARRSHALVKISRIGSGHACWPLHQWPL